MRSPVGYRRELKTGIVSSERQICVFSIIMVQAVFMRVAGCPRPLKHPFKLAMTVRDDLAQVPASRRRGE